MGLHAQDNDTYTFGSALVPALHRLAESMLPTLEQPNLSPSFQSAQSVSARAADAYGLRNTAAMAAAIAAHVSIDKRECSYGQCRSDWRTFHQYVSHEFCCGGWWRGYFSSGIITKSA